MAARVRSGVHLSTPDGQYHIDTSSPPVFCVAPNATADDDWSLATLSDFQGTQFGQNEVESIKRTLEAADDVWRPGFLATILLRAGHQVQVADDLQASHRVIVVQNDPPAAAPGPYAVQNLSGKVFSVSRLYRDTQKAFVGGVLADDAPDGSATYRWFGFGDHIPVPSRLYSSRAGKALSGLRFAVKDVIDLAGLPTGCGSAAWAATYPAPATTAPLVLRLVAAGAVLVGKLRCAQFCDGQDPLERLEEETPWNPRGDGLQKPSSSSSGSAAAASAYPWLDFTIGTDTGGSIRHPAAVCGIFGLRPSLVDGTTLGGGGGLVVSELMDVVGPFTRSVGAMQAVTRCLVGPKAAIEPRFRLVVLTDSAETASKGLRFFPPSGYADVPNPKALEVFHRVLDSLEKLSNLERQNVNPYELWRQTHPEGTSDDLVEATRDVYSRIVYSNLHRNVISKLSGDYRAIHAGEEPFVEPLLKKRVKYGARVSPAEYEEANKSLGVFRDWVNKVLLSGSSDGDDVIPILVFPQSWGLPQYRDDTIDRTSGNIFWSGFSAYSISYCSGCPDITVPVGRVPAMSKFTETEVQLPIALSFLSPKGTDLRLLGLLGHLEERGVLKAVQCGRTLYPEDE